MIHTKGPGSLVTSCSYLAAAASWANSFKSYPAEKLPPAKIQGEDVSNWVTERHASLYQRGILKGGLKKSCISMEPFTISQITLQQLKKLRRQLQLWWRNATDNLFPFSMFNNVIDLPAVVLVFWSLETVPLAHWVHTYHQSPFTLNDNTTWLVSSKKFSY